ncbi:MAG TPA: Holliday junction branch migration DNA helicase RuvB [Planctomycetota bacterium]|nr:Holliday junction branch migration DNA helicase RuvB [Planctomycetota bacterium]
MARKKNPQAADEVADEAERGDLTPRAQPDEDAVEATLRPQRFSDFVGQERVKENLQVYVKAATRRGAALDHVLLSGPPGLGKTTLARIIAQELGFSFQGATAPALKRPGDLVGLLTSLPEKTVLFIDEIHRLPAAFEEYLYSAMEDFFIDVPVDQGPSARSVRFNLKPFTLIGATTRDGLLSRPFQDRFGIPQKLTFYTPEELARIVSRSASILSCKIDEAASREIAGRARKTPRIANRLLRRLRDWADVQGDGTITHAIAKKGLEREGVDAAGLDGMDRKILQAIAGHQGTPVGVKTIAVIVGEEEDTIEDVYEPFLIQEGYVLKTPRGRLLSKKGYAHLGLTPAETQNEPGLF